MADPQDSIGDGNQADNSGARPGPQAPKALTDGTGSSDAKSKSEAASPVTMFYRQRTSEALGDSPPTDETEASLWRSPSFRFALLAASIVVAAVAGSFGGALIASEFMRRPAVEAAAAAPKTADRQDARDLVQTLKAQLSELAALKASLDGANHTASTQLTKISDRLDALFAGAERSEGQGVDVFVGIEADAFEGSLELLDVVGQQLLLEGHGRRRIFNGAVVDRDQLQQVGGNAGAARRVQRHGVGHANQE